jgi:hypothetical protein
MQSYTLCLRRKQGCPYPLYMTVVIVDIHLLSNCIIAADSAQVRMHCMRQCCANKATELAARLTGDAVVRHVPRAMQQFWQQSKMALSQ